MNKKQLVDELVTSHSDDFKTKVQTKRMIETILEVIKTATANDNIVSLYKFGVFETATTKDREGTTPKGTKYISKSRKLPKFRASKAFKKEVNND